jgi:hypothetical protein
VHSFSRRNTELGLVLATDFQYTNTISTLSLCIAFYRKILLQNATDLAHTLIMNHGLTKEYTKVEVFEKAISVASYLTSLRLSAHSQVLICVKCSFTFMCCLFGIIFSGM